jgi:hypothetical protein
MLFDARKDYR